MTEAAILLILITLVVTAVELYLIIRLLREILNKDVPIPSPPQQQGQNITINVNEAKAAPSPAITTHPLKEEKAPVNNNKRRRRKKKTLPETEQLIEESKQADADDQNSVNDVYSNMPTSPPPIVPKMETKKCPECGMENSKMRNSCYNCGKNF